MAEFINFDIFKRFRFSEYNLIKTVCYMNTIEHDCESSFLEIPDDSVCSLRPNKLKSKSIMNQLVPSL